MSREPIPQDWGLRLQLAAIAGNEPTSSYFELRFKRAQGGMGQDFIPIHEAERAAASAINRGQMSDVYVGVCPRVRRSGKADAVERVWCLWADIDNPAAVESAHEFRPSPSIVVRTGSGGAHLYWPLRDPISPEWAQRANRRLALALAADEKATDPARILRPPGTLSHKHSPPRPVVCTRLELDVYMPEQVVGRLPDDPRYLTPPRCFREPIGDPSSVLDGLARTVREAVVGNRNAALFWAACRVRERAELGQLDDNEAREALRDAALAAGLGEQESERTLDSALDTRAAA